MVFNATFNNISVLSWQSVLFVEETGVSGENHVPVENEAHIFKTRNWVSRHNQAAEYSKMIFFSFRDIHRNVLSEFEITKFYCVRLLVLVSIFAKLRKMFVHISNSGCNTFSYHIWYIIFRDLMVSRKPTKIGIQWIKINTQ